MPIDLDDYRVWMSAERNPWAAVPAMTLVQRGHLPPPEPGAPGIFALWEAGRVRELVSAAGFAGPESEEIRFDFHYPGADDLWDALISLAGPLARAVLALPQDEREASRRAIVDSTERLRDDGSYTAPAATWGVLVR